MRVHEQLLDGSYHLMIQMVNKQTELERGADGIVIDAHPLTTSWSHNRVTIKVGEVKKS